MVCCMPPERKKIGAIPDFLMVGSQIGNLAPGPSFAITCVLSVQMGYLSPFRHLSSKKFLMI
jgi:hypothetical protein